MIRASSREGRVRHPALKSIREYDDVNNSSYQPNREGTAMQRVTITIDDDLAEDLERYMTSRGYANRSEAVRDLARSGLQQRTVQSKQPCVAALIYVYDHYQRELPKRLTRNFHNHHDLTRATLHVHLDHQRCMEVTVLKGRGDAVKELADHVIAERGVRHGQVVYLPGVADVRGSAHRRQMPANGA
jgi:CopG family transcriptional regulator, nickel-responsive regulator